ncbi:ABC transporter permease [Microtetraspora malaysiensis]|uniref:ABC transporter permease n=1 Tax=Microtetraspora malaysiensis TaxID=161358 RepID=UPI00082AC87A|nr:ABC transporter permease [Microtetraspora malaysiensis]
MGIPNGPRTWAESKKKRIDTLAASAGRSGRGEGAGDGPGGPATGEAGALKGAEGVSLLAAAWRRLRRNAVFLIGAAIVLVFVALAIIAPWIAPHDPAGRILVDQIRPSNPIPQPQPGFPLGGDSSGRDLLSRLLVGARQTLFVGVMATLGGLSGGVLLGTLAGAFGGPIDSLIMRIVDVMLSIPALLMAFTIAAMFAKPTQWTVIMAIAIVQVPIFARLLRGSMLAQRRSDHVLAARALGVKQAPIVIRHMLPNSFGPVIVQATLVIAGAIIDAAALSFLGLGNPDDRSPEWGQMLGKAQEFFNTFPHLAMWPAACIIVVALGFTLMGESLREALDPKSQR